MAERPDPETNRRNILPGEHAKPDGTWCPYLAPSNEAGVWVCMKCGNSGGVSTPATDPNTLADELNMDADYWVRLHADQPKRPGFDWMLELAGRERAAADGLRQYAAITDAIGDRQRIADALTEVADYHVTECVDMHGDQGEDGPGDGCCFHARAAYRVGDAARLLRGAASLSPTPTPDHCPTCDSSEDPERTMGGHWTCYDPWHDSGQP